MQTQIHIKYAIFIMIVYFVTCMMYGTPFDDVSVETDTLIEGEESTTDPGINPFGFGIINGIIGAGEAVARGITAFPQYCYAGLRFLTFDFSGFPWFFHIFLGMINAIMIIFFILDFIHGFI